MSYSARIRARTLRVALQADQHSDALPLCAQLLAGWRRHEDIAGFQDGCDFDAETAHLQARAREHVAHGAHLLIPYSFILRILQAFAAAFDGRFRNHAVVEASEQHLIWTIVR